MKETQYYDMPPETNLLAWYLAQLSSTLQEQGDSYSITELYDDLPTRAYLMMRVFDELDFYKLYPAQCKNGTDETIVR